MQISPTQTADLTPDQLRARARHYQEQALRDDADGFVRCAASCRQIAATLHARAELADLRRAGRV